METKVWWQGRGMWIDVCVTEGERDRWMSERGRETVKESDKETQGSLVVFSILSVCVYLCSLKCLALCVSICVSINAYGLCNLQSWNTNLEWMQSALHSDSTKTIKLNFDVSELQW